MGISFGRGLTFKSGMTLIGAGVSAPVALPDTMTVASGTLFSLTAYGASDGNLQSSLGTLTSDYFSVIAYIADSTTPYTTVILKDGSYSGFSVSYGAIDGDTSTYPRVFSIDGNNYTFIYDNYNYWYVNYSDVASLQSKVGNTISITYNTGIQPSLTSDTIIVGSVNTGGPSTNYGASVFQPVFGTVVSSYITALTYDGTGTNIRLRNGTYTGFSVSNGLIDTDTTGSTRKFTIGGSSYTFTSQTLGPTNVYQVMGDPISLSTNVGNTISAIYDPAAQGGGGGGSGTTYTSGVDYSSGPPGIYFSGPSPENVNIDTTFWTNGAGATALLALTNGSTFTASVAGTPTTITLTSSYTNPFGPVYFASITASTSINYGGPQVVPSSITLGGGGGGSGLASGTMTVGTFGPFWGFDPSAPGGGFGSSSITPSGLLAHIVTNGSSFTDISFNPGTYGSVTVVASPTATINGSTTVTVVVDGITATGTLGTSGPYVNLSISSDIFNLSYKNGQTLNVSVS